MPDRQYDDAFALLEKSFNNSSFMRAYQSLPFKQKEERNPIRPVMNDFTSSSTVTTITTSHQRGGGTDEEDEDEDEDEVNDDDAADDSASDGSLHEGYGNKAHMPISLNHKIATLPPTPPTQMPEHSAAGMVHVGPLPAQNSRLSTPVYPPCPLTPDLTPPSNRPEMLNVPRPPMPQFSSSRTESFVTAREDPSLCSTQSSQISLPLAENAADRNWLDASRSLRSESPRPPGSSSTCDEKSTGSSADDDTPTRRTSHETLRPRKSEDLSTPRKSLNGSGSTADVSPTRNVTVRKQRSKSLLESHAIDMQVRLNGEPLDQAPANLVKQGQTISREHDGQNYKTRGSLDSSSTSDKDEHTWHTAINDMLYKAIRDEKSKRLSGISQTSTTVEAVVIPGPRPKKRILRHAGKNLALRDDISSSRSSLESTVSRSHSHSLRHKKAKLPSRLEALDDTVRSVSNPEAKLPDKIQHHLHHTRPSGHLSQNEYETANNTTSQNLSHRKQATTANTHAAPEPLMRGPSHRLRHASAPLSVDSYEHAARPAALSLPYGSKSSARTLETRDSLAPPSDRRSASLDNASTGGNVAGPLSDVAKDLCRPNLYDQMPISPRISIDQSHANARHLHASKTPGALSQVSDRTDAIDISEAQAVNLYPHGNDSLLLVQHPSRRHNAESLANSRLPSAIDEISTPTESDSSSAELVGPLLSIFPASTLRPITPLAHLESKHNTTSDSPLLNPRPAPMPPVVVIPPTPVPDLEAQANATIETERPERPGAPQRRGSLVQRARRYSESFMQPFLPLRITESRRSTSSQRPVSEHDRNHTLHPFWRPRAFWDDLESDDSELGDYESYLDPDPEHDRLPPGGDTSDVASLKRKQMGIKWPRKMSVRMPGFSGSGGFLVGNTLGIDRHGTNNRRHYIDLRARGRREGIDEDSSLAKQKRSHSTPATTFVLPFFASSSPQMPAYGLTSPIKGNTAKRSASPAAPAPHVPRERHSSKLKSKSSTESLSHRNGTLRKRPSQRSLRRQSRGGVMGYKIPGLGLQVQALSVREIQDRLENRRVEREETRREARRKELRGLISKPALIEH
ncbi:hypothetical protein AAFC00_006172 [Neodothiora populina]|uniref:Uncharacterized protein n=1 Tax=Neodothiora populina TaxID=2781224 RepID=A0ABR3P4J5_9PEZI